MDQGQYNQYEHVQSDRGYNYAEFQRSHKNVVQTNTNINVGWKWIHKKTH